MAENKQCLDRLKSDINSLPLFIKKEAKPAKEAKVKTPKTPTPKRPTPKTPTPKTTNQKNSGSSTTLAALLLYRYYFTVSNIIRLHVTHTECRRNITISSRIQCKPLNYMTLNNRA